MTAPSRPFLVLDDPESGAALLFDRPEALITAHHHHEVGPAFAAMEAAQRDGLILAGYAAYELGYALEPRFGVANQAGAGPLLQFGAFRAPRPFDWSSVTPVEGGLALEADWRYADYERRIGQVLDYIRAGDVYQINLTFALRGRYVGDPLRLFAMMRQRQPVLLGGVIALGEEIILSASPELFFQTQGGVITTRPMKGTAPRRKDPVEDAVLAEQLRTSTKDRAENVMIVDLLRNDVSRLAEIGSVKVPRLFEIETYPTLHQMTSTVTARLRPGIGLQAIFAGLFPCGSVTGAPKIRAMEIIRALEAGPRGAYCGAVGMILPNGDMKFNVAIRTACLRGNQIAFHVGSGVVYDSQAQAEWDECHLKARVLTRHSV